MEVPIRPTIIGKSLGCISRKSGVKIAETISVNEGPMIMPEMT